MTTVTLLPAAEPDVKYPELIEWRKQDQVIAEMREQYMPLKIDGLDDKKGLALVHAARMQVKSTRVAVEKKRKELKEDALNYGRLVDGEAKRLTAMLEPIEAHLQAEEDVVISEQKRIAREAEEAKQRALQARMDALAEYGVFRTPNLVEAMSPEDYAKLLSDSKNAQDEKQRLQAEADAKRKDDDEALATERKRLEEIRKQQQAEADRQKAEQARLAAVQKQLDDERLARERTAELEKAKAEAAEKARIEAEQRHAAELSKVKADAEAKALREKQEAEAKVAREKAEADAKEAAKLKAEAERPQREKIEFVAKQIEGISIPKGQGESDVRTVLTYAAERIRTIAAGPHDHPRRRPARATDARSRTGGCNP